MHNLTNPLRFLVMATSLVRLLASWSVNTRSTSKKAQYNAAFAAEMAANETSMQRLEEELTLLLGLPPSGKKKVQTDDACQILCTYVVTILNRLFCNGLIDVSESIHVVSHTHPHI